MLLGKRTFSRQSSLPIGSGDWSLGRPLVMAAARFEVAARNLRPDAPPEETGDWRNDLAIWLQQFVEEMSSEPGREMLREVLGGERSENAGQCSAYTRQQLEMILDRAAEGEDRPIDVDKLLDRVIAPIMYRILFTATAPDREYAQSLLDRALESGLPHR